jgi:thiamine-monophosphate kinase
VRQIADASGVGITIDAATIPLGEGVADWHAREGGDPIDTALSGGDDYELLFTVRPAQRGRFRGARGQFSDLPVTKIGVVTKTPDVQVRDGEGVRPMPQGYEHFRCD